MATVAEMRETIANHYATYGGNPPAGYSKMRKADLEALLFELTTSLTNEPVNEFVPEAKISEFANDSDANAMLAGALYMAGVDGYGPSVEESQQLNYAKYLGRYHAKRVQVRSMGRHVAGRVIENVLRERDLLLVVKLDSGTPLLYNSNAVTLVS